MATFVGTIVKFEEDGVWLSAMMNGVKLYSPTELIRDGNGNIKEIPARNVLFNEAGEFKIPYESPRVITPKIPAYQKKDDYIGDFCLYICDIFDDEYGVECIAVEVGDDALELSSKWN